MKFKAGDSFRVIENNLIGKIVGISFNSVYQQEEYVVKWPNLSYEQTYPVDECDSIWELEPCPVVDVYMKLPTALNHIEIKIDMSGPVKVQCNGHHTWVDIGFQFTKQVCKYCDVEKGKS